MDASNTNDNGTFDLFKEYLTEMNGSAVSGLSSILKDVEKLKEIGTLGVGVKML